MNQKYTVKQTELSDDLSEKRTFTSQANPAADLYISLINYMVTRDLKGRLRHSTLVPSLPHRRFWGSSSFVPPHKRLLNWVQHFFPKLSQSHCTFQILESWPWPQGNLIITRSAWNTGKSFFPLKNVRFWAAEIRFSQILEHSKHCITLAKERK